MYDCEDMTKGKVVRRILGFLLACLITFYVGHALAGSHSDQNVRKSVEIVTYLSPSGNEMEAVFACFSNRKGMGGTAMDCHRLR